MRNEAELKIKVQTDTKSSEVNLKKMGDGVVNLGEATNEANKQTLKELMLSFSETTVAVKNLASATKSFIANEIGINEAKNSIKSFLVNATAGFLKLREAFSQEASFSAASRTIEGTDQQLKELNRTIQDLASTDLAVPVEELNNVASVAGAMGKSVESIPEFVQTVSEGVVGLAIPAEQLAEKLGTLQTQLDLTEEGLVSLSDQVNSVADTLPGKVKELDIFEVMSMGVATAGKQFGLLKGETIALTGSLLSLGEAPETARTGIINLLSSLQNSKNQTQDFQDGLAALGTSSDKLATDIKAKPLPALMQLLETMNGMSNVARLDIATKLLGKGQDAVALTKLVDNTNLLKQALATATDATQYSGSVHEAYAKQVETAEAKVTILWNAIKNLSAGMVDTFLPVVKLAIDGFTGIVNAANRFSQNHPIIRTFAEVAGTVLSLGGALRLLHFGLSAIGLLSPAVIARIAALGSSFLFLSSSVSTAATSLFTFIRTGSALAVVRTTLLALFGGTIGLAIGAVALLATGIAALLPKVVQWGDTTATVGEIIAAAWRVVIEIFDPLVKLFSDAGNVIADFVTEAMGAADFGDALAKIGREAALFVTDFVSGFKFLTETIVQGWAAIAIEMEAGATMLDDIFSGKGILESIATFTQKTGDNMSQFSNTVKENVDKTFGGTTDTLDKFNAKIDASLKKSRGEKPLDKADTRATDNGVDLVAPVDDKEALKQAAEKARLEKEIQDRQIQAYREEAAERIRLYTNVATTQKQINDFSFQEKLLAEQKITALINQSLADELAATDKDTSAKRTALLSIEQATSVQVKNLIALEQEHRNKAVGFLNEITQLEQSRVANNRALDDMGLTAAEVSENKRRQLATDTIKLKQLLAAGEWDKAAELGKKTIDLAAQIAEGEKKEDVKRHQSTAEALNARKNYNDVVGLTKEALEGASKAELAQANIAKEEADKRKLSLDEVRGKIAEIEQAVQGGVELKVSANTSEVDDAKERLKQPTHSTHTIDVVENRVQAHAVGGYITQYQNVRGYANGGLPIPLADFKRRQGYVVGKGTPTSDEIPSMLSNTEYVLNAKATAKIGKNVLDAANFGGATLVPVANFADGGAVGDDELKKKADEFKKQAYTQAKAVFDDPKNQIIWRMGEGKTSTGSEDPNSQQRNFERRVGDYLKINNLPLEWRDLYFKGAKAEQVLRTGKASFEDKAKAQLELDNQFATPKTTAPTTPTATTVPLPTSIAAPSLPVITPPSFSPVATASRSGSVTTGKVSTIKFERPDGKTTTGNSTDPDFAKFFDELNTVSGVTKV